MESENISPKSRLAAALLCFFLGVFGAHRFYLKKNGTAILMILTLLGVYFTLFSFPWGSGPWLTSSLLSRVLSGTKRVKGYTAGWNQAPIKIESVPIIPTENVGLYFAQGR